MLRFTLRHAPAVIAFANACLVAFLQHDHATGFLGFLALLVYAGYVNGPAWRQHRSDEEQHARELAEDRAADEAYTREFALSDAQHASLMDAYDRDCEAWDASGQGVWGTPSFPSETGRVEA